MKILTFKKSAWILTISISCTCLICFFHLRQLQIRRDQRSSFSEVIEQIPKADQEILEEFFRTLVVHYNLGYVLYGNKPMVTVQYVNPFSSNAFDLYSMDPNNLKMKKGVECWRKYYKFFPSNNFTCVFFGNPQKDQNVELVLINKKRLIEIAEANINKFRNKFGRQISGVKLLEKIVKGTEIWDCDLNYEMIGLLLGYGESNSHYFQRRSEIILKFYGWKFTLKKLSKTPKQGYATIDDEIKYIQNAFRPLKDDKILDKGFMVLPSFFAIADLDETLKIKHDYELQRKKLIRIYRGKSFFKETICKYTQEGCSNSSAGPK